MLYVILKYLLKPIVWLLFRPKLIGRENLDIKGKAILVCNHFSMLDPVMMMMSVKRSIHFMAKAELFRSALGRMLFRSLLAFPVNRKGADMASVKKAMRLLNRGEVFGIFPEGKRAVTRDMDELEKGAAFLASHAGAPIIPMYIRRDSYKRLKVVMAVGEPILVSDIEADTHKSRVTQALTCKLEHAFSALKVITDRENACV